MEARRIEKAESLVSIVNRQRGQLKRGRGLQKPAKKTVVLVKRLLRPEFRCMVATQDRRDLHVSKGLE